MSKNAPETEKKAVAQKSAAKKRRKRARGVPTALTIALIIVALFFGGLFGYIVANQTNTYRADLELANARVAELENTLTMMGFSDGASTDEWIFDDTGLEDEFSDLTGQSDSGADFWSDAGLTAGSLELGDAEPVVVAEFDGGNVMSTEVVEPYNDALAMQVFNNSNADDVAGDVLNQVLAELVADKVLYNRAKEMGLTELSDEDLKNIQLSAEAYYADQQAFYAFSVDTAGMSEADAKAAIDAYLRDEVGITLEGLVADEKETYWIQKLYAAVTKDVIVTDEALQAAYDALLASQKPMFTASLEEYEYATMVGEPITYNPEGYRRVKQILLPFADATSANRAFELTGQIAGLDPTADAEQIAQLQAELDALYTELDAQAQTIITQLQGGADFDEMVAQYSQDDAMMFEPTKTTGYYISASSTQWAAEFVDGCMALEEPGQISTPVYTPSGVHIIQYVADVPAGEVPLADVQAALSEQVLSELQEDAYTAQVAQWVSEANAKYYPERLQ